MVVLSWISFLIPPNSFPGRISLLVTIVLCIINVMTGVMQQNPEGNAINTLDCWCIICLALVAIASLEYAILLYFMRFGKVQIHSAKERSMRRLNKEEKLESNSVLFKHANYIDHCSLLVIPALFILTAIIYFTCCLYKMLKCEHVDEIIRQKTMK